MLLILLMLLTGNPQLAAAVTNAGDVAALKAFNLEVIKASGKGIPGWFPANQSNPCGDFWSDPQVQPYPGVLCPIGTPGQTDPLRVLTLSLNDLGIYATSIAPITQLAQLQALILIDNNFSAPLPPGLFAMPFLKNIDIRNNQLHGTIPNVTGAPLATLQLANQTWGGGLGLTGGIPVSLGKMTALSLLDLSLNTLSGSIPPSLTTLPKLNTLILRSNNLTGKIPRLGQLLSTLQTLDVSHNPYDKQPMPTELNSLTIVNGVLDLSYMNFIGPLIDMSYLGALTDLILDGNHLTGQLYPKILPRGSLGYLSLKNNKFSGPIRPNLLDVLNYNIYCMTSCGLVFANNQFSGRLPASLGSILQAFIFDFSNNRLTGPIPNTYGYVYSMLQLFLQNNRLTGPLPDFNPPPVVTYQLALQYLDISNNLLSGSFPAELSRFTRLNSIDFSNNLLYGTLPRNLTALQRLQYLNVSLNRFSGMPPPVPAATVLDYHSNYFGGDYSKFSAGIRHGQHLNAAKNCFTCGKNNLRCKRVLPTQLPRAQCFAFCRCDVHQPPCGGGVCNFWNSTGIASCQCPGQTKLYNVTCP